MKVIPIEPSGYVVKERIVTLGRTDASGIRRLIAATDETMRIDLTFGRKRKSALVLDTGHVVITALSLDELHQLMILEETG